MLNDQDLPRINETGEDELVRDLDVPFSAPLEEKEGLGEWCVGGVACVRVLS